MSKTLTFIMGCGRSGTNLIGKVLSENPEVLVRLEDPFTFPLAVDCALGRMGRLKNLASIYKEVFLNSSESVVIKDHPVLFFWPWLNMLLRESGIKTKYVIVVRDMLDVIASTLKHKGCSSWLTKPPSNLNGAILYGEGYYDLPLHSRAFWRWQNAWNYTRFSLGYNNVFLISYEQMILQTKDVLTELSNFIEVSYIPYSGMIYESSIGRGKNELSQQQLIDIGSEIEKGDKGLLGM